MKGIAIYVEGGGDTVHQRAELRTGLDQLLRTQKDAARAKRLRWRVVPSGGRRATFDAFRTQQKNAGENTLTMLLVDSETPIATEIGDHSADAKSRVTHLSERDGWDFKDINPLQVHLMVQCMEAWLIADSDALARYYGKAFHTNKLPLRANLEDEPKDVLSRKLADATRDTSKGHYHKIRHASKLLTRIDAGKVAQRCPHFKSFCNQLMNVIEGA